MDTRWLTISLHILTKRPVANGSKQTCGPLDDKDEEEDEDEEEDDDDEDGLDGFLLISSELVVVVVVVVVALVSNSAVEFALSTLVLGRLYTLIHLRLANRFSLQQQY